MFIRSKFAATLSKAVAARSSTEMTAALIAATVVATAASQTTSNNNNNNATTDGEQQQPPTHDSHYQSLLVQRFFPATVTSCESLLPSRNSNSTPPRVSRLARRRTIQRMQDTSSRQTLESKYIVDTQPLGEGAFGQVFVARHRETGDHVAVKKIPKQLTSDANFQCEMEALMYIRAQGGHPHICGLRENFEEGDHYYLVLDLVSGGEMFDHLCDQGPYSEADAARLVREVASALAFCHGIGLVHGDMKPENLMLSSENPLHACIKVVDFGCAQVTKDPTGDRLEGETTTALDDSMILHASNTIANTPAYCPPEILDKEIRKRRGLALYNKLDPAFDMWALGVIIYIMLTGIHPFDVDGTNTDEQVEQKIINRQAPPLRNSPLTAHLSESALSLIEQLIEWDPSKRLTAHEMLDHPWVRGETARTGKMADSDKKLSAYKAYKSRLEARVFADMVQWADDMTYVGAPNGSSSSQNNSVSLLERAFHNLDASKRGFITTNDLRRLSGHKTKDNKDDSTRVDDKALLLRAQATSAAAAALEGDDQQLDYSSFSELLSDNMKNRYFPKGHVVYREGDQGDQMFFINSGTIQVSTSEGHTSNRTQGDTFGEGALLNKSRRNTSTIKCITPVHAIEISRSYFDRFMKDGDADQTHFAKIHLSEKDKTRKRERAKRMLRDHSQKEMREVKQGDSLFHVGDAGNDLFILEDGKADVVVGNGKLVYSLEPGEMCGDHSVAFDRPRNTSTLCTSSEGCKFRMLSKEEYKQVVSKGPWWLEKSLRDISLRREFQKAIVMKTGQPFPTNEAELRRVFEIADVNQSGKLELDNIRQMLQSFDKSFTDKDVKEILTALDLDESNAVSFEEFKRMFLARVPKIAPK